MYQPKNTVKEAKETMHHLQQKCCNTVQEVNEDMREVAFEAGQKMREIYDMTTQETREAKALVEERIRLNPIKAGAIAATIGFVLGALFRRYR